MNYQEQLDVIEANMDKLAINDHDFATSLIQQFDRNGALSEKQIYWVNKLFLKASGITPQHQNQPHYVEPKQSPTFPGIVKMFANAAGEIKYPKIIAETQTGVEVKLYRQGERSKNAGGVCIQSNDPFEYSTWYGSIDTTGNLNARRELGTDIMELLVEMEADTMAFFKVQGQRTGKCGMCGRELTNEESINLGIGPICRGRFGL